MRQEVVDRKPLPEDGHHPDFEPIEEAAAVARQYCHATTIMLQIVAFLLRCRLDEIKMFIQYVLYFECENINEKYKSLVNIKCKLSHLNLDVTFATSGNYLGNHI